MPEAPDDAENADEPSTREYQTVTDAEGVITVDVPDIWSDIDGSPVADSLGNEFYNVIASPDAAALREGWDVSGVQVGASTEALDDHTPDSVLGLQQEALSANCTEDATREPYDDGLYEGVFEVWGGCGGGTTVLVTIAGTSDDGGHLIWANVQLLEEDVDVLETIIGTFRATMP